MFTSELPRRYEVEESTGITIHTLSFDSPNASKANIGLLPNSSLFNHLEHIRDVGEFVPDPDKFSQSNRNSQSTFSRSVNLQADKFTLGAQRCLVIGIFATGSRIVYGSISEMYHLPPSFFLWSARSNSDRASFQSRLSFIKSISDKGSIQAVVAGGSEFETGSAWFKQEQLKQLLKDSLSMEPVILEPKYKLGATSVYLQTADKVMTVAHHIIV